MRERVELKPEESKSALRVPPEAELWDEFLQTGLQEHELRELLGGEEDLWAIPGLMVVMIGDQRTGFRVYRIDHSQAPGAFHHHLIERAPVSTLQEFEAALARKALSGSGSF